MIELVREIDEFDLIERLSRRLPPRRQEVVVGIGDDVAVLTCGGRDSENGSYLLVTCDVQVEGVHFLRDRITPHQLGRKVAAINLSDIAAMGGHPRHFLVSLALPPDTPVPFLEALYDGLAEEAARWEADVVGGNLSRSTCLTIDLTLLGEVRPACLLRRSGAQVGDKVLVTGYPGLSAAGLALLLNPVLTASDEDRETCLAAHLTPTPRLAESSVIAASGAATAMVDVSDGLSADLGHLCAASGVGVELWEASLPVSETVGCVSAVAGKDLLDWVLGGGEDYELLFTVRPDRAEELAQEVTRTTGTPVAVIGEILPVGEGSILRKPDGRQLPLLRSGWKHFGRDVKTTT